MTYFPEVHRWGLPRGAWRESLVEMARDGGEECEGVALWLGTRAEGQATVTHVVVLRGGELVKRRDLLVIGPGLMNAVTDLALEHGVALVGQVHSHGRGYGVDLSPTDKRYGVAVPYYLSVVAPDYARSQATRVGECGVHVFLPGVGYRRLPLEQVAQALVLVDGEVPVLVAEA